MVSSGGPGPLGPLVLRVRAIADSWRVALPTTGDGACMGGGGGAYHHSPIAPLRIFNGRYHSHQHR